MINKVLRFGDVIRVPQHIQLSQKCVLSEASVVRAEKMTREGGEGSFVSLITQPSATRLGVPSF